MFFDKIDYKMLVLQKQWLLTQQDAYAEGLIALIDALQDAAVAEGEIEESIVFQTKKWRVFDAHDCFGTYDTIESASESAQSLIDTGLVGVQMHYMTEDEFEFFIKFGTTKQ